jgi:hypothetical protein
MLLVIARVEKLRRVVPEAEFFFEAFSPPGRNKPANVALPFSTVELRVAS